MRRWFVKNYRSGHLGTRAIVPCGLVFALLTAGCGSQNHTPAGKPDASVDVAVDIARDALTGVPDVGKDAAADEAEGSLDGVGTDAVLATFTVTFSIVPATLAVGESVPVTVTVVTSVPVTDLLCKPMGASPDLTLNTAATTCTATTEADVPCSYVYTFRSDGSATVAPNKAFDYIVCWANSIDGYASDYINVTLVPSPTASLDAGADTVIAADAGKETGAPDTRTPLLADGRMDTAVDVSAVDNASPSSIDSGMDAGSEAGTATGGGLNTGLDAVTVIDAGLEVASVDSPSRIVGTGSPSIKITSVPPFGSGGYASGRVSGVDPSEYFVALYIFVQGTWWMKPWSFAAETPISPDGTWSGDITTGGVDQDATAIAAYLLPVGDDVPSALGDPLPPVLANFPSDTVYR